jgi:hypothetical protein
MNREIIMTRTRTASLDDHTLSQLIDMAMESYGAGVSIPDVDITSDLRRKRDDWEDAVRDALLEYVSHNESRINLSGDLRDAEDVVNEMMGLRGDAPYLYFMEMEDHGVGTWDSPEWEALFVDGSRGVKDLSNHVKRKLRREFSALRDEIDHLAQAGLEEYEESSRYASRRVTASDRSSLIRLASSLEKGDETRRAILAGLQKLSLRIKDDEMKPYEKGGKVYLESTHTYEDEESAKKAVEAQKKGRVKGVDEIRVDRRGKHVFLTLVVKGDLDSVKRRAEGLREDAFSLALNVLED